MRIGDGRIDPADRSCRSVIDPAHGETIDVIAIATRADLDQALAAAQRGFDVWRGEVQVTLGATA
jgi:succinate-semialdehyde dehydrogenase / glutarate-semialdehyde dehydrogenase